MADYELQTIEFGGNPPITYSLNGASDHPCILLIHGWTGGIHEFDPVVSGLNAAGWQTLAVRMPGDETSPPFQNVDSYSLHNLADLHHDVVSRLSLAPVVVLGFSMGGAIADEFVLRYPDDARALVVLGSAGFDWVDDEAQFDIDEAEPIVFDLGMEAHYDVWKKRTDPEGFASMGKSELEKRRAWWARTSPNAYVGGLYGLLNKRDTLPDLVKLDKPTLIVHGDGEEDSIIQASARAAGLIPVSSYEVIAGASHFAQEDNPEEFLRVLVEWLRQLT